MKLSIHNFRCHKTLDLEFPDTGLVLVDGASGAGKSTILNAIFYALFDKTTKPYPFETKKGCKVVLDMGDIVIQRTKSPNRLVVTVKDYTAEDKEAEQLIYDYIGMDDQEFLTSSYIRQKQAGSLLYKPPAKQLEFISHIAYKDARVEELRSMCSQYVKRYSGRVRELDGTIEILTSQYQDLEDQKPESIPDVDSKSIKKWKKQLQTIHHEHTQAKDLLHQLQQIEEKHQLVIEYQTEIKDLTQKRKEFKQSVTAKLDKLDIPWKEKDKETTIKERDMLSRDIRNLDRLNTAETELSNYQKRSQVELEQLQNKLHEIRESLDPTCISKLESEISDIKLRINEQKHVQETYDRHIKQLKYLKQLGIVDTYPTEGPLKKLCKKIKEKLNLKELKSQLKLARQRLDNYKHQLHLINISSHIRTCPSCGVKLRIKDENLIQVHDNTTLSDPSMVKQDIVETNETIQKLETDIELANKVYAKLDQLKEVSLIPVSDDNSIELLKRLETQRKEQQKTQNEYNKLSTQLETMSDNRTKRIKELKADRKDCLRALRHNDLSIDKARQMLDSLYNYMEVQQKLETDRARLEQDLRNEPHGSNIDSLNSKIDRLKSEIPKDIVKRVKKQKKVYKKLQHKLDDLVKKQELIQIYDQWKSWKRSMKNKQNELKQQKMERMRVAKGQESYSILLDRIKQGEHLALENAVGNINTNAATYLDQMFDDPISIDLRTFREMKSTKSVKAQINTHIEYKGWKYDDLSQVSGGEQDRINLGYTVALSSMFNSRILMLDEALNSLNKDLNTDIIDSLRKVARDKLVLVVSHEAERGLFDQVVTI